MDRPIYNPRIPFTELIPGGFGPGRLVRIQGSTAQNSNRFSINLMCGPNSSHDDIGLHLNARFDENVLVRNSKTHSSSWGPEEREGHLGIGKGQNFEILILCEIQEYKIAINGQHFTDFIVRVPLGRVTHIGIEGQVTVSLIQFEGHGVTPNFAGPSAPMMMPYMPADSAPSIIGWAPAGGAAGGAGASPYPPQPSYHAPAAGYPPAPNYGPPAMMTPYPPQPQPQGYYAHSTPMPGQPQLHQGQGGSGSKGGNSLQDKAGKMLGKVGLGGVANKIPGASGGGQSKSQQGYSQGPGQAAPGQAGPQYYGDVKPKKKDKTKGKLIKYGVPIAGVALAGYAVKKIID